MHYDYRDAETRKKRGSDTPKNQRDTGILSAWGDPSFLRIQGLHIKNSRRAAISVYGKAAQGSSWGVTNNVDVNFNTTYKSYAMGIIIHRVNNVRVIGNRVVRPHSMEMSSDRRTGEQTAFDHGSQEAIDLSRNKGFEIAFNEVYGGSKEGVDCISVEDGEIHHNYVQDCLNGIYIDSWSVPIRNLEIHHNFIKNAYSGIPLATEGSSDLFNFDIHHNIIIDSKMAEIAVTEATYKAKPAKVQKINVYNNTIHNTGGHATAIGWQASGIEVAGFKENREFRDITIKDNIVTNTTGRPMANEYAGKPEHNIRFAHNQVYPEDDSTPEWMMNDEKRAVNNYNVLGASPVLDEPQYLDPENGDFRLRKDSPARSAGSDNGDIGALPYGTTWVKGMDWSGKVTAYYTGSTSWEPVFVAPDKYTMHRNHLQRPSWFQLNRYGADFQNLPFGTQCFAGAEFYIPSDEQNVIPTVMVIRGKSAEVDKVAIKGVSINRNASKMAFLHNYHMDGNVRQGDQLFHYLVRYEDGKTVEIPVRWQVDIGDWLGNADQLHDLANARLGWNMEVQKKRGDNRQLRLYVMEWKNPRPEAKVISVDIINDQKYLTGAPAVFGIAVAH